MLRIGECFPGADVRVESSDVPKDRVLIVQPEGVKTDAKLDALEAAETALEEASLLRFEDLRRSSKSSLKAMLTESFQTFIE